MAVSLIWVLFYIVSLFLISAFCIKKALNSFEEYSFCGRQLSIGYIIFTYLGTWIGGGTIIGLVARSYTFGANQYWVIALSCFIELIFASVFIRKIRNLGVSSIPSFFALKFPAYGGIVRIPVTIGILIRNVTMVGMQFIALSYLITFLFDINRNLAILLIFLIITFYTVLSGLWGVVMTDVFQGLLQTAGLLLLAYSTVKLSGGLGQVLHFYEIHKNLDFLNMAATSLSLPDLLFYVISFGLFFLMSDQTSWERIFASKSDKTAMWGFIVPIIITLITLVLITYLGVFQRVIFNGEVDPQTVLYQFLFESLDSNLTVIILVGLIAAIMSSADSFLLASGILFSQDIIKAFLNKNANDKELIFWTRAFIIVTGSIGFAFALHFGDILYLWLTGIGMASIILVPGYFLAWFTKRPNTREALAGMGVGIFYVSLMALGWIDPGSKEICIGIALNFLFSVFLLPGLLPALLPLFHSSEYFNLQNILTCIIFYINVQ